jgi:hypothetical protein
VNRRTLLSSIVTAFAVSLMAIQIASLPRESGPGATFAPSGSCGLTVVSTAFARSGTPLRRGDTLALDRMSIDDRVLATQDSSSVGDRIDYVVTRDGVTSQVTELVAVPEAASLWTPSVIVKFVTLLVGLFLLWRGRDRASLHYGLASSAFAIALLPVSDGVLAPGWRNVYEAIAQVLAGCAAYALYLTFEDLAAGSIAARVLAACRAVVAACALLFCANAIAFSIARASSGCFIVWLYELRYPALVLALVVMFSVLAATFIRARGLQRQRVRWLFWSTVVGFSGVVTWLLFPSLRAAVLTSVVITIGYAYAILRHRVIDVGFVINRAIVFTIVTTLVFGIFAVISSFVERMTLSRNDSIIAQSVAALVLAFSFDFGYKRVEGVIDRLFFRDRRAAVLALRRYIDEARYIRKTDALLDRAVDTVRDSFKCSAAVVFLEHGSHYRMAAASDSEAFPTAVDVDDAAFVRLRTYLSDVDLGDAPGSLGSSGYAFAMAVQNRLLGALVVGNRDNEENYDPEERDLLRSVAREVAAALAAIGAADRADLVEQLASGAIDVGTARRRAQELTAGDFSNR